MRNARRYFGVNLTGIEAPRDCSITTYRDRLHPRLTICLYRNMNGAMKLRDLESVLALHPDALPRFTLPDGDSIPAHFHITEVGHVAKRFIDCGGTLHETTDTCLLQTYVADDVEHRLTAGAFAKILQLGDRIMPHDDLDVEVEYDCCVVAQYPIASARFGGQYVELQLGEKHTDCLAQAKCGIDGVGCEATANEATAAASCC